MDFSKTIKIHFNDADPAGICFFANIFTKVHQVFETYLEHLNSSPIDWFLKDDLIYPIRHTEANFLSPLKALNTYQVYVLPVKVSETSFQLRYQIFSDQQICAEIFMTHTGFSKKTRKKFPLPESLAKRLQKIIESEIE